METKLSLHDNREETDEGVDYIIFCPECEQPRHKSWFRAGVRGCAFCEATKNYYIDQLAHKLLLTDQKRQN
jgi:hypothetical protein